MAVVSMPLVERVERVLRLPRAPAPPFLLPVTFEIQAQSPGMLTS